jgi:hypothetical protein
VCDGFLMCGWCGHCLIAGFFAQSAYPANLHDIKIININKFHEFFHQHINMMNQSKMKLYLLTFFYGPDSFFLRNRWYNKKILLV